MKASRYNLYFEENGFSYFFNGLTKLYFRIPVELGRKIHTTLQNNVNILFQETPFGEKMLNSGFLIQYNKNELVDVLCKRNYERNRKDYFLVILPTLDCNFNCWYCIQDHIQSVMSEETKDRILRHIDYMIETEKIDSLHIEWFGGEPFMYFEEIIKPIASYAQAKCLGRNIPFKHSATTNGYYLSESTHPDLKKLSLRRFHITLDGNKEKHDLVKFCSKCCSAFERTLNNINKVLSYDENSKLILRINYTDDNLDESIIYDVNNFIESKNRSRVSVYFKKVWQVNSKKDTIQKAQTIREKFEHYGYDVTRFDFICNFISCYVEKHYYNAINFNGNIVKCTATDDLHTADPYGCLSKNGEIIWNNDLIVELHKRELPKPCAVCQYLPLCMGPCPHKNNIKGPFKCKMADQLKDIPNMIITFVNSRYEHASK